MKAMPLIPYKYLFSLTKRYDNDISKITPPLIPDIPCQYAKFVNITDIV